MKKIYESPELIAVKFTHEDTLTISGYTPMTEGIEDGGDAEAE